MGNSPSLFFRLLSTAIPAKGDHLRQQIIAFNQGQSTENIFITDPNNFDAITSSPIAYWANERILGIFNQFGKLESDRFHVFSGTSTGDDCRFLRLFWEVYPQSIGKTNSWIDFPKGGTYSKFYSDPHLVINWTNNGAYISECGFIRNPRVYFHAGLTYPPRTQKGLNFRVLPAGCVYSHKGPAILSGTDNEHELLALMSIINSTIFEYLAKMQMAFGSFEIGVIQNTPIPTYSSITQQELSHLAYQAYKLTRKPSVNDETTHVFILPALFYYPSTTLTERLHLLTLSDNQCQTNLKAIQAEIDSCVADLYGVPELRQIIVEQSCVEDVQNADDEDLKDDGNDEEVIDNVIELSSLVADLLMWCVGVAFGRWDVRLALDPSRLPELPGPFDPLPVCSPGMLTGADGLPLNQDELPSDYPLPIAWDGFLVDDPDHPDDILSAVEHTLALVWPGNLEELENEACKILGVSDLRAWFRDPRGFFSYHIKRYSKSRRKAPIYWLLQSSKRNYAIWLYYPRLNPASLYRAGREYADLKLQLETGRLADWQRNLKTTTGSAQKVQERKIATQEALVEELKAFVKRLDTAALLEIKPDLNDGVLLNIALLQELTPWKEADRAWGELLHGKYGWSSIGKQLRQKGLVKEAK